MSVHYNVICRRAGDVPAVDTQRGAMIESEAGTCSQHPHPNPSKAFARKA